MRLTASVSRTADDRTGASEWSPSSRNALVARAAVALDTGAEVTGSRAADGGTVIRHGDRNG